jgi:hypothetical protein
MFKQQAIDELIKAMPQWGKNGRTFEEDMRLEVSDSARLLIDSFAKRTARLMAGDFSALIDAPIGPPWGKGCGWLPK